MSVTAEAPIHPIAARLRGAGITEIVVIDDAFDVPDLAHVSDVEAFWRAVREDEAARQDLKPIADVGGVDDIDDEVIAKLWALTDGALAGHASKHLFVEQHQQQKDVLALCTHLKAIGFDPQRRGAKSNDPVTAKLVFLDYVLDSKRAMDRDAIATEKATAIFDAAPDGEKPFIVLMSDQEDALRENKTFRRKSKLIAGLFGFLTKTEVASRDVLFLRLGSWGIGNKAFGALQSFVSNVLAAVETAASDFSEQVRELEVHDYSFIQKLSLHKDGHPLGDYLMWLFESTLGHRLRDDARVRGAQTKLDATTFEKIIPCQRVPSDRLAQFYLAAVTEPAVSELQAQPFDTTGTVPLLFMGDIFFKDATSPVLMVVTAGCDLMFRPMDDPPSDETQPIYLAPGRLVEIASRKPEHERACTELIFVDNRAFRIDWDTKHVESKRLGTVWSELTDLGYERRWRLRLPYALEVQQEFSAHLTRVGLPVAPPLFHQADVEVFVAKGGKATLSGSRIEGGAALMKGDKGTEVVLTRTCIDELLARLEGSAAEIEASVPEVPDGEHKEAKVARLLGQASKVRAFAGDTTAWLTLLEDPFKLPAIGAKGKVTVHQTLLWAYFETVLEGSQMGQQPTFSINITLTPSENGQSASSPAGDAPGESAPRPALPADVAAKLEELESEMEE